MLESFLPKVFRNDGNWYFKFRVHESPFYRRAAVPERISDTGWSIVEITGSSRDGLARHHRLRCFVQIDSFICKRHAGCLLVQVVVAAVVVVTGAVVGTVCGLKTEKQKQLPAFTLAS